MAKLISKLYTPANLLEAITAVETVLASHSTLTGSDIVIDLRRKGYKIVKVDNGDVKQNN